MMRRPLAALLVALSLGAAAQVHRHDPLTPAETDALREAAMEPDKKLPLYLKYARERMAGVEQARAGKQAAPERGRQIHDLLEDFRTIMDEMDRNLDSFANQKLDFRNALKEMVKTDGEFQAALAKLKESAKDPANAAEGKEYEFAVLDASDAVDGNLDNAKDLLQEQEKAAAEAKAKAKEKSKSR